MRQISVAIAGCGDLFQHTMLPRLMSEAGRSRFVVRALCGGSSDREPRFANELGGAEMFDDYQRMLERTDAEAVWLLTPAQQHVEQAVAALRAGKHVYVQKPMAPGVAGVDAIIRAAQPGGLKVVAAPAQMVYPTIRRLAEIVRAGRIGQVYFATSPFMGWGGMEVASPNHPGWRYQTGNGPLRDHGAYSLTTLISVLGRVESVAAFSGIMIDHRFWKGRRFEVSEHDNTAALLRFESGAVASLHEAWCPGSESAPPLRLFGIDGAIETFGRRWDACPRGLILTGPGGGERERIDVLGEEPASFFNDEQFNSHVWADVLHLADCIEHDRPSEADPQRVRHVYEVIDAIYTAAATGVRQHLGASSPPG